MTPPQWAIDRALELAARSTCRSKRGVVIYAPSLGRSQMILGEGFNGPPPGFPCDGTCARGTCGKRAVHAESRAIRQLLYGQGMELVHVEIAPCGGVVPCGGPSCVTCSREIVEVGCIARVWLYEAPAQDAAEAWERWYRGEEPRPGGAPSWRSYTAAEFHRVSLRNAGIDP